MVVDEATILQWLEEVCDPEIPVLTINDLGIIKSVTICDDHVDIVITPTYSGCPAMDLIEINIKAHLQSKGIAVVNVQKVLDPAWTTDWITENGRAKLLKYGIAPPVADSPDKHALFSEAAKVPCPRCGSHHTTMISLFGSTACKALYRCEDCKEPFDYFKCLK